ncbi:MAG: hypothetical protein QXG36_09715, partial [Nitrososphaeria archaeon]
MLKPYAVGRAMVKTRVVVESESINEFLIVIGTALSKTLIYDSRVGLVGKTVGGHAKASAILLNEFRNIRTIGETIKAAAAIN